MWRFFGALGIAVLLYVNCALSPTVRGIEIHDCGQNSVCLLFTKDSCEISEENIRSKDNNIGVVWPTTCGSPYYEFILFAMDMDMSSPTNYKVTVTPYAEIEKNKLTFDNSVLTFTETNAIFSWNYNGKNGSFTSKLKSLQPVNLKVQWIGFRADLPRYQFNIEAEGQKLIHLVKYDTAKTKSVVLTYPDEITMKDDRYNPRLSEKTPCIATDLGCFGGSCSGMTFENGTANSSSTLRYRSPSDSPGGMIIKWNVFDRLECDMGDWQAVSADKGKGAFMLDSTYEVSCSAEEPSNVTDRLYIIVGSVGGGLLLAYIVTVITVGFCARRLRRNGTDFLIIFLSILPALEAVTNDVTKPTVNLKYIISTVFVRLLCFILGLLFLTGLIAVILTFIERGRRDISAYKFIYFTSVAIMSLHLAGYVLLKIFSDTTISDCSAHLSVVIAIFAQLGLEIDAIQLRYNNRDDGVFQEARNTMRFISFPAFIVSGLVFDAGYLETINFVSASITISTVFLITIEAGTLMEVVDREERGDD